MRFIKIVGLMLVLAVRGCAPAFAQTNTVTFYAKDTAGNPVTNRTMLIYPLVPSADYAGNVLSKSPMALITDTNGAVTTNLMMRYSYQVVLVLPWQNVTNIAWFTLGYTNPLNGNGFFIYPPSRLFAPNGNLMSAAFYNPSTANLADATNLALLNGTNTFTGTNTFNVLTEFTHGASIGAILNLEYQSALEFYGPRPAVLSLQNSGNLNFNISGANPSTIGPTSGANGSGFTGDHVGDGTGLTGVGLLATPNSYTGGLQGFTNLIASGMHILGSTNLLSGWWNGFKVFTIRTNGDATFQSVAASNNLTVANTLTGNIGSFSGPLTSSSLVTGNGSFSGTITGGTFSGNGGGLTNLNILNWLTNRLAQYVYACTLHGYTPAVAIPFVSNFNPSTNGFIGGGYTNVDFSYGNSGAQGFQSPIKIPLTSGSNFTVFVTYKFPTNMLGSNINGTLVGFANESSGDAVLYAGNTWTGYQNVVSVTNFLQNSTFTNGAFYYPQLSSSSSGDLDGSGNVRDAFERRTDWLTVSNNVVTMGRFGIQGQLGISSQYNQVTMGPFHAFNELLIGGQFTGITQLAGSMSGSFLTNSLAQIESVVVLSGPQNSNIVANATWDCLAFNPATNLIFITGDSLSAPAGITNWTYWIRTHPAAAGTVFVNSAVNGTSPDNYYGANKRLGNVLNLLGSNAFNLPVTWLEMLGRNPSELENMTGPQALNTISNLVALAPPNILVVQADTPVIGPNACSSCYLNNQSWATVYTNINSMNALMHQNTRLFSGGVLPVSQLINIPMVNTNGPVTAFSTDCVHFYGTSGYLIGQDYAALYWRTLSQAQSGITFSPGSWTPLSGQTLSLNDGTALNSVIFSNASGVLNITPTNGVPITIDGNGTVAGINSLTATGTATLTNLVVPGTAAFATAAIANSALQSNVLTNNETAATLLQGSLSLSNASLVLSNSAGTNTISASGFTNNSGGNVTSLSAAGILTLPNASANIAGNQIAVRSGANTANALAAWNGTTSQLIATGASVVSGAVTATSFTGDGSGLTGLSAANLTGTIANGVKLAFLYSGSATNVVGTTAESSVIGTGSAGQTTPTQAANSLHVGDWIHINVLAGVTNNSGGAVAGPTWKVYAGATIVSTITPSASTMANGQKVGLMPLGFRAVVLSTGASGSIWVVGDMDNPYSYGATVSNPTPVTINTTSSFLWNITCTQQSSSASYNTFVLTSIEQKPAP